MYNTFLPKVLREMPSPFLKNTLLEEMSYLN